MKHNNLIFKNEIFVKNVKFNKNELLINQIYLIKFYFLQKIISEMETKNFNLIDDFF